MIGKLVKDKYEIKTEIGIGGMARVFLAYDIFLKRDVALKMLHPYLTTEKEHLVRFEREAVLLANLDHPNIIRVYEYFTYESNYFIASEYIKGETLKEFLLKHKPKFPAIGMMIGYIISDAINYAHKHNIVHRDIKPENIMISSSGELKVMDFGIARISNESTLTSTGAVLGSPAYMSPEQALGRDITKKTDVFSIGIVLYQLITGISPFQSTTPISTIRNIIRVHYDPASRYNGLIDNSYEKLFSKVLLKDYNKRVELSVLIEIIEDILIKEGIKDGYENELKNFFTFPDKYQEDLGEKLVSYYYKKALSFRKKHKTVLTLNYCNKVLEIDSNNVNAQVLIKKLKLYNKGKDIWKLLFTITIVISLFYFIWLTTFSAYSVPLTFKTSRIDDLYLKFNKVSKILFLESISEDELYLAQIINNNEIKERDKEKKDTFNKNNSEKIKDKKKELANKKLINKERIVKNRRIEKYRKKIKEKELKEELKKKEEKEKLEEIEKEKIEKVVIKSKKTGSLQFCFKPYAKVFIDGKKQESSCTKVELEYGKHIILAEYPFADKYVRKIELNNNSKKFTIRYNFAKYSIVTISLKSTVIPIFSLKRSDGKYIEAIEKRTKNKIILKDIAYKTRKSYLIVPGVYFLDIHDGDITYSNIRVSLKEKKDYKIFMDLINERKLKIY